LFAKTESDSGEEGPFLYPYLIASTAGRTRTTQAPAGSAGPWLLIDKRFH
jgi:hypothetical protein